MYRILICDENQGELAALKPALEKAGCQVTEAFSWEETLECSLQTEFHLVLLDCGTLPERGFDIITEIRAHSNLPIILLSEHAEGSDMISGLDSGADDYITKPFLPEAVAARVKSQLRRYMHLGTRDKNERCLRIGDLILEKKSKRVTVRGKPVSLTPLEYDILSLLMQNPDRVFSSKEIYQSVWKAPPMGAENAVAVHIRHIREKIEESPAKPVYLKVVWGKGYMVALPHRSA